MLTYQEIINLKENEQVILNFRLINPEHTNRVSAQLQNIGKGRFSPTEHDESVTVSKSTARKISFRSANGKERTYEKEDFINGSRGLDSTYYLQVSRIS